eukprot:sb/3472192/
MATTLPGHHHHHGGPLLFSETFRLLAQDCTTPIAPDILLGKVVCLLFGASWSPPFLDFLDQFRTFYNELQADGAPLEVIYISFDRSEVEMRALVEGSFPESWVCIPHGHNMVNYLKLKYSVVVIPKLIVVRDNGAVITDKGVKDIRKWSKRCFTSWYNAANNNPETASAT